MNTQMPTVSLFSETLSLAVADRGHGRPFLLLHGGAGPGSMTGLAGALGSDARALVPTHPGFERQPRPEWFHRVEDLTLAYLSLLDRLDLRDVVVVGNSLGGWIAAEMALRASPRIAGIALLNAVGIDTGSPDRKIVDAQSVPVPELLKMSFHDPAKFAAPPASPEAAAIRGENQKTLRVYAGDAMFDPTLRARLAGLTTPTLVVWGQSDRIVDVDYGRLFASSIPGARFELVPEAGHFPQVERAADTTRLLFAFASGLAR